MNVMFRRAKYFLSPQLEIYKNLAPLLKDRYVFEVGFGTGVGTLQYAHLAKKVVAIDIDRDCVEFAKDVFPQRNVEWEYGDILKEQLGLYDAIVMIEVIEHIEDWENVLKICSDRLLHDGLFIVSTPNANGTFIKNPLHGDEWTTEQFRARLEKYFDDVKLFDFSLEGEMDERQTPMVGICRKRSF